jgi:hypothetical protein
MRSKPVCIPPFPHATPRKRERGKGNRKQRHTTTPRSINPNENAGRTQGAPVFGGDDVALDEVGALRDGRLVCLQGVLRQHATRPPVRNHIRPVSLKRRFCKASVCTIDDLLAIGGRGGAV